jgi:mono/diheme cytochrome c family protein
VYRRLSALLPPGLCLLLGLAVGPLLSLRPAVAQADMPSSASRSGSSSSALRARLRGASDLFQRRCARCHGADGTGSTFPAPDFTNARWHRQRSDDQLLVSILEGKGRGMPAFRGKLSDEGADELVTLIRTFDPTYDPAAARRQPVSDDEFRKRFRLLEAEMEHLKDQYRRLSEEPRKP